MSAVTNHAPATVDHSAEEVLGIEDAFPEILRITEELFGSPASLVVETDPELPDVRYAAFQTAASGSLEEVSRLRHEWYDRTAALLGDDCEKITLLIDWQE